MTKQDLLAYIEEYVEDHGYEPTMRTIKKECSLHQAEAYSLFNALLEDGSVIKLNTPRSGRYVLK